MNVNAVDDAWTRWIRIQAGFEHVQKRVFDHAAQLCGATAPEVETLLHLQEVERHRMRLAALAEAVNFSTGGYTKVADRLCSKGLAQRVRCEEDRRTIYLQLTQEGLTLARTIREELCTYLEAHFFEVIGGSRTEAVLRSMDLAVDHLHEPAR